MSADASTPNLKDQSFISDCSPVGRQIEKGKSNGQRSGVITNVNRSGRYQRPTADTTRVYQRVAETKIPKLTLQGRPRSCKSGNEKVVAETGLEEGLQDSRERVAIRYWKTWNF